MQVIRGTGMRVFGGMKWRCRIENVATPVGELCSECGEPIEEGASGVVLPHYGVDHGITVYAFQPRHRECFIRTAVGSVGHQTKACSCYGGTEEDPPGLTRREAAKAAAMLFDLGQA